MQSDRAKHTRKRISAVEVTVHLLLRSVITKKIKQSSVA
ncbi:hypothetical protein OIU78_012148 [Salix suchowensis]|nr:hypothetical protein OIU78_012148 [Salix suchowensis]